MLLLYPVRKSQAPAQVLSLDDWEPLQVRPDNRRRTSIMSVRTNNALQLILIVPPYANSDDWWNYVNHLIDSPERAQRGSTRKIGVWI